MSDVGSALASMLGGGYVNYFSLDGRSYKVIPQVEQRSRLNTDQLLNYYIRAADGTLGAALDDRQDHHQDDPGIAQSFPAAQQRHDPGRRLSGRRAGDALDYLQGPRGADAAAGLHGRLRRPVAPVRAGIERLRRHLRLRADHHLPVARRPVRELPRSADHPGLGADVDRRRAALPHRAQHLGRAGRHAEHLHRGRPGHADGPDQQARHPDRRVRQRAAAYGKSKREADRGGRRHPPAARS